MNNLLMNVFHKIETLTETKSIFQYSAEVIVSEIVSVIAEPIKKLNLSIIRNSVVIERGKYFVNNDLIVLDEGKLIIEAGVQLFFGKSCGIVVLGSLEVKGNAEDLVVITGDKWKNITFVENSIDIRIKSFLKYVVIHGGNGSSKNPRDEKSYFFEKEKSRGGNIFSKGRNLLLDHVIISNGKAESGGGMFVYKGILEMRNCIVCNNEGVRTGGIEIYNPSFNKNTVSNLSNVVIDGNKSIDSAGGISINKGTIILDKLFVQNNYSEEFCGGMIIRNTSINPLESVNVEFTLLKDSVIMNNSGSTNGGLYCSNCFLIENIFSNNKISNNIARDSNSHDFEHQKFIN
ncbi:MAG: hypothetical protein IPH62_11495 [Ignavibacteriae bacterium]|nr:hypothetical protein [Ignavibacteriota bacterium]